MQFTNFDHIGFLREYWQKRPAVIRNPWRTWSNPVGPDELAGFACEDDIESRLIIRAGKRLDVEQGPFAPKRFAKLGKSPWTLLVQAVDHHVPGVAALMAPFRFIPNWRIDDVMVSYASDGGGVGAHFDQYDVFLIQGLGTRRWQVGHHGDRVCTAKTPLLAHDDLTLLGDFAVADEWLLESGDILYVPPGVAHHGVAVGDDCMTYSIGFRAPARSELIAHFCDHLLSELEDDDRYGDPGLLTSANPGEIPPATLGALHQMIVERLADKRAFTRWFGEYTSAPKYPEISWEPDMPISERVLENYITRGGIFERNAASRFVFVRDGSTRVMLFVDGKAYGCDGAVAAVAEMLCAYASFTLDRGVAQQPAAIDLLIALINRGCLMLETPDDK